MELARSSEPTESVRDPGYGALSNCGAREVCPSSLEPGQAQPTYQADGGGAQESWQSVTLTPNKPQKQLAEGNQGQDPPYTAQASLWFTQVLIVWSWLNWMC